MCVVVFVLCCDVMLPVRCVVDGLFVCGWCTVVLVCVLLLVLFWK